MREFEEAAARAEAEGIEGFLAKIRESLTGAVGHDGTLPTVLVLIQRKYVEGGDDDASIIEATYQNASIERRIWLMEGYKHALYEGDIDPEDAE